MDNYSILVFWAENEVDLNESMAVESKRLETLDRRDWGNRCARRMSCVDNSAAYGAFLVTDCPQHAADVLKMAAVKKRPQGLFRKPRPSVRPELVWMFSGMGNQYPGMGEELGSRIKAFQTTLVGLSNIAPRNVPRNPALIAASTDGMPTMSFPTLLSPESALPPLGTLDPDATTIAHPAILTIELALAKLWQSWGLTPDTVLGYSIGEYAAATVAGVFSPEHAIRIVTERALLIESLSQGSMLAVGLPPCEVRNYLPDGTFIAACCAPMTTVVAGRPDPMERLRSSLATARIPAQPVNARQPFHTPLLEPLKEPLEAIFTGMPLGQPRIRYVSGKTGTTEDHAIREPEYWIKQSMEPVQFADALSTLLVTENQFLLELGPGLGLSAYVYQHPGASHLVGRPVAGSLPNMDDPKVETAMVLESLGRLWLAGFAPHWTQVAKDLET